MWFQQVLQSSSWTIIPLQVQLGRTKEQVDKLVEEKEGLATQKTQTEEKVKGVQRQLRDLREEFSDAQKKEMEVAQKNKELVSVH